MSSTPAQSSTPAPQLSSAPQPLPTPLPLATLPAKPSPAHPISPPIRQSPARVQTFLCSNPRPGVSPPARAKLPPSSVPAQKQSPLPVSQSAPPPPADPTAVSAARKHGLASET